MFSSVINNDFFICILLISNNLNISFIIIKVDMVVRNSYIHLILKPVTSSIKLILKQEYQLN